MPTAQARQEDRESADQPAESPTDDLAQALARLTPKKQLFVEAYINSWDGRKFNVTNAAIACGLSPKTAYSSGSRMLKDVGIFQCIQLSLRPKIIGAISSIEERKETLTEIHRGRLHHFGTAGADGFIPNVGSENINSAALAQIETRVEIDKASTGDGKKDANGCDVAYITKLKLESKCQAIDLLNKMDGLYLQKVEVNASEDVKDFLAKLDGATLGPPKTRKAA